MPRRSSAGGASRSGPVMPGANGGPPQGRGSVPATRRVLPVKFGATRERLFEIGLDRSAFGR